MCFCNSRATEFLQQWPGAFGIASKRSGIQAKQITQHSGVGESHLGGLDEPFTRIACPGGKQVYNEAGMQDRDVAFERAGGKAGLAQKLAVAQQGRAVLGQRPQQPGLS